MEKRAFHDYGSFRSNELICDPFFQSWVLTGNVEENIFWQQFLLEYPQQEGEVTAARSFLQQLRFKENWPEQQRMEELFEQHWQQISRQEHSGEAEAGHTPVMLLRRYWWAAAVLIAACVISVTWYRLENGRQTIATAYGMRKNITLPDGSLLVLNAHSSVAFDKRWLPGKAREVWLEGEGFFDVRPGGSKEGGNAPQPFLVHTRHISVEVLGTRFDIRDRREQTEVALESGRVAVSFIQSQQPRVVLKPGELLVYHNRKKELVKDTTNVTDYSAWKKSRLILRNPTVREIANYLEDNFGYRIITEDSSMWQRKVSGPILYDSLNDALFILSTVLNTKVVRTDSTIVLRPR